MKTKYLLLAGVVVVLASCSTAYRNGQTPDDVYYSPAPSAESYVIRGNKDDRNSYRSSDYTEYTRERDIRQGIRNPRYRNSITLSMGYGGYSSFGYDPFYSPFSYNSFGYNPFGYTSFGYNPYYGKGFYDPFGYNPYYSYNPYYPPFGYNPIYSGYYPPGNYYPVSGKTISNNRGARQYNLGSYAPSPSTDPRGINSTKSGIFRPAPIAPVRTFESRSSAPVRKEGSGISNGVRRVFTPSNNRTNTPPANNRRVERSNTPPVRRFDPPVRSSEPPVRSTQPPVRSSNTPPVRSTNNPPVRTFDPSPSPAISTPAPSASSSSTPAKENGSAPVRTFRNN